MEESNHLKFIKRYPPIIFAVARAIVEAHGSNPDKILYDQGTNAPIWTDHIKEARSALNRTAIMLRAQGTPACMTAAAFILREIEERKS